MRIAFTGAAGIGKTTMATRLAGILGVPLLEEEFKEMVLAFNPQLSSRPRVNNRDLCRRACLRWLERRETLLQQNESYVEDRCAIDVLVRWLLANLSDRDNHLTQTVIEQTRRCVQPLDCLVILPLLSLGAHETANERGLVRTHSTSRLMRGQSLAIGLSHQLLGPKRLIFVPEECGTVADRAEFLQTRLC
jgi:hypothetical protein